MSLKFIHVREEVEDDRPSPCGGTTVAFNVNRDINVVEYAYSRCSKHDHYCKKQGRIKASGRMKSAKHYHSFQLEGDDPVVVQVLSHVWEDIAKEVKEAMEKRV